MRPPVLVVSCSWLGQLRPAASDCVTGWTARHWGFPLSSPLRWVLFRKLILFHRLLLGALWKMLVFHFCQEIACLLYHCSLINELYLHVDVLSAEFPWSPAHKTKHCNSVLTSCSDFEFYLKMKYPHAPVLCISTGRKCCAENRRAHTQPPRLPLVFVFVCVVFGNFVQFPSISVVHRFRTHWLSFAQLCRTFSTLMTKLMQTRQGITWGGEKQTKKKPPKQLHAIQVVAAVLKLHFFSLEHMGSITGATIQATQMWIFASELRCINSTQGVHQK